MNKNELRKLAERVRLQISNSDLGYFKRSFSAVLPMVTKLLNEKIAGDASAMERIISTPLKMSELGEIERQFDIKILSEEEIEKNSFLKASRIIISKKHE